VVAVTVDGNNDAPALHEVWCIYLFTFFPSILCFVSDLNLFRMFDHMLEALILLFW